MDTDFTPSARVIADSISPADVRLTTIEVTLHRYMLPELNTHRAFSRNSASSRAIPVRKLIQKAIDTPALPVSWRSEQKGMQGGQQIADPARARDIWLSARDAAVAHVEKLVELGVHKSVANRLLEPFLPHTVIVTATEWFNFWVQRCNADAQDDIRAAAEAMRTAYDASQPQQVPLGHYHLPYITDEDFAESPEGVLAWISAARCARVSYLTHDGRRSRDADLALFDRLRSAAPPHASPLEHVAAPTNDPNTRSGNFHGWRQLRELVLGR